MACDEYDSRFENVWLPAFQYKKLKTAAVAEAFTGRE